MFLNEYEQGGGPLIDIGTHALDLTLWLMNNYKPRMVVGTTFKKLTNPDQANPWGPWDEKQHTVEDSAFGFIVMENGATIILEAILGAEYLRAHSGGKRRDLRLQGGRSDQGL